MKNILLLFISCLIAQCSIAKPDESVKVAAERTTIYFPLLKGKSIGVIANQTSMINTTHLVDSLLASGLNVTKVFCPEHGFRGTADAGEHVDHQKDAKTGLPIISLYGSNKKPSAEQLDGLDILLFDIQDVGARFYTYISTLYYVMEACAEKNLPMLILDRPNPNGFYVDGPVLQEDFKSFVGIHKIPVVHGMTIAEYAQMINGEHWLPNKLQCEFSMVLCDNYTHSTYYELPIKPSPNLPNMASVYLYPSLCLFEGTVVSIGRGTDIPFQCYGHPKLVYGSFLFTPESVPGAKNPKLKGEACTGFYLGSAADHIKTDGKLQLNYLLGAYKHLAGEIDLLGDENFFNSFFDKLAGSDVLRKQIEAGVSEEAIRASWQADLKTFKVMRKKYLLYDDFE